MSERVIENLNRGLRAVLAADPDVFLLGEDVCDPYGGAFKASRGLSTSFPDRVLNTPIAENAIVGVAAGLALAGHKPIAEMMFGDFITLGFDQIVNFATKSATMYGRPVPMNMVVRCPVGGGRSYGPTHSQNLQKHFLGVPGLRLFELTPFHDSGELLGHMLSLGTPSILFEDKVLYSQPMQQGGAIDDLFTYEKFGPGGAFVRVAPDGFDTCDVLMIAPGGMLARCLSAAKTLLIEDEIIAQIVVPVQLYPFDPAPVEALAAASGLVLVAEEGTAGGTWGGEVASQLYARLWGALRHRVVQISSRDSIIPCAPHLERQVLIQSEDIYAAIKAEVLHV